MDSLGKILKEARLNLNVSLGQIAKDTKIAKRYLDAIEDDDFSIFPGDTYLKGFLRTYCEYLKLDPEEIINKFEKIKIAESPIPIDKLIIKPKINLRPLIVIIFFIAIVALLIMGGIYGVNLIKKPLIDLAFTKSVKKENNKIIKKIKDLSNTIKYRDNEEEKTFNFKKSDLIEFSSQNENYQLKIKELSPTVVIELPNGKLLYLIKSYRHNIDINNDNDMDLTLNLNYWNDQNANITMISNKFQAPSSDLKLTGEDAESIVKKNMIEGIEFSLDILFPTFLRYKIDEDQEIELYYKDKIKNGISAKKRVIIWLSNAGAVEFNFNGYNKKFSPGKSGEIAVKLIQWNELPSGEFELQVSSLN